MVARLETLRGRFSSPLLLALICARVIAGCSSASPPAPGSTPAAATSATASSPTIPAPAALDLCRPPDLAPAVLLSTPGYRQLAVSLTDADGAPISGLKQSDFTVRSGPKPSPIVYFREESSLTTPVSLVIVGDVSASMFRKTVVQDPDELAKVRVRLSQGLDQLSECDEVALVMIGGKYLSETQAPFGDASQTEIQPQLGAVTLAQSFTTNHVLALQKMYSVMPTGEKRLSDGIRVGLGTLSGAHYPNRAMIVMTDGLDHDAIDNSAPLLAQVRDSGVSFWVVGIGDPDAEEGFLSKLRGTTRMDAAAVKNLAIAGGGQVIFAKPVESDEGASLAAAVTTIGKQLGQGYALGIEGSPGKVVPSVTVANHPGAIVRADLVPSEVLAAAAAMPAEPKREVGTAQRVIAPDATSNLPGYTEMSVTVAKPDGSYVEGLKKGDFNLSVDGAHQPINFFRAGEASPATVGILVDTSGSMMPKLPQARAAIEQFVNALDARDDVFLIAFSNKPYLLQPVTNNHDALIERLGMLHAYGQTALFDTIKQGISAAQTGSNQRKVLLVITDGMDNMSSSSADDVVQAAKSSGVLVYSIGIGDPNGNADAGTNVMIGPFVMSAPDEQHVDAATLSRLASANGSKSYIIHAVGDGDALKKACKEIANDLHERHSYVIGFVARTPANYAPSTMPMTLQVPAHVDYAVQAPNSIPVPIASSK
jgi:VWFA-related protein